LAWTSAPAAPTSAAPTAAPTAITTSIAAIEITAATVTVVRTVVKSWRGIVLGRVVLRRKVLRRRFVRIGLTLILELLRAFRYARLNVFARCVNFLDVRANFSIFRVGMPVSVRGRCGLADAAKRFSRKNVNRLLAAFCRRRCGVLVAMIIVTMAVIVMTMVIAFEILENVADIEKSITVEADVHESGLHARQHACDFSFIDTADEGELFFALDVDFD
jgi:hypothetical protein